MDTERLIRTLAENVEPVRPLRRPMWRTLVWTAPVVGYLLLLVVLMSPRDDLDARLRDWPFLLELGAGLLAGMTAAAAAFATVVPGYRRRTVWLALVSAGIWLAVVTARALGDLEAVGFGGALVRADWRCAWTVLAGAALPAAAMATMLRQGVPLTPHLTAALGGLAAAGVGNLGICLFHPHDSNVAVLVWHCGTVLLVAVLAGAAGGQLLRWKKPAFLSV